MRVFLGPDDRKIAATAKKQPPPPSSSSHSFHPSNPSRNSSHSEAAASSFLAATAKHRPPQSSPPSRKKLKSGGDGPPPERVRMGGGGRSLDRPAAAAWQGATPAARTAGGGGTDAAAGAGAASGRTTTRLANDRPSAAVAAAASSPHRSTLNAARRHGSNPEDDEGWQDSKPSSTPSRCIFLGKSNEDANTDHRHHSRRHYEATNGKRAPSSSSALLRPSPAPAPLLNGPIPGSTDDPATMPKTMRRGGYDEEGVARDERDDGNRSDPALSRFVHRLRTRHAPPLDVVEMEGDGNCLFRAVALQVYGDVAAHAEVRRRCLDFMEREADHFRDFVAGEDFGEYVARKRAAGVHGNHAEIQAMSELYNRSIEVFVPTGAGAEREGGGCAVEPINIFHSEYKSPDAPIRLCYMDGNHYDAVTDPMLPTAGLGLGLPGLQPGLADKLQLDEAKKISDESAMEEKLRLAMKESNRASKAREEREMTEAMRKSSELNAGSNGRAAMDSDDDVFKKKAMYLSEMEAADFDLEQAVLASSLESYREAEQERKLPSLRRGEGRRARFNSSPRNHRSSSNSPVQRSNAAAVAATASSPFNQYNVAAAAAAATSLPSASAHGIGSGTNNGTSFATTDEYPPSVQELVMNGFELSKVLHAYDLVGDNFDDLLSFLLSSTS